MAQTVAEVLAAGINNVTLINEVNSGTNEEAGTKTQAEINEMVQRNVDHLELMLAYAPLNEDDDTADIAGDSSDKSSYTDAIATGNTYITNNS